MNNMRKTKAQLVRELEIEAALKRIRSRALAMQESQELSDVAVTLWGEFESLKISIRRPAISLFDLEHNVGEIWAVTVEGEPMQVSRFEAQTWKDSPVAAMREIFEAYERGERALRTLSFTQGEFAAHLQWMMDAWDLHFPNYDRDGIPEHTVYQVVYFPDGCLVLNTFDEPLPDEAVAIAQRFADEFGIAYSRFRELKEKEAQNKELKVQNALERVRARALGMQTSEEMLDVVSELFDVCDDLGFSMWSSGIAIVEEATDELVNWWAHDRAHGGIGVHRIPLSFLENMTPGGDVLRRFKMGHHQPISISSEECDHRESMAAYLTVAGVSQQGIEKYIQSLPESMTAHFVFFNRGWLGIYDVEGTLDLNAVARLADVFAFGYGRFLELKEKEDQNRELTIQNALERIRSRALGMQTSDEIAGVATALFNECENMDFGIDSVNVSVCDFEREIVQTFVRNLALEEIIGRTAEELEKRPAFVTTFEELRKKNPTGGNLARILEVREKGEPYIMMIQRERDENIQRIQNGSLFLTLSPEQQESLLESVPERLFRYRIFFSQGVVVLDSSGELTDEDLSAAQRFTEAFDFAYDRFRELREAEEQAREAERRAAVDRVRAEATAMEGTEDIINVVKELWEGLHAQGLEHGTLTVQIEDQQSERFQIYLAAQVRSERGLAIPDSYLVRKDLLPGVNLYRSEMALSVFNEIASRDRATSKGVYSGLEENLPQVLRHLWNVDIPQDRLATIQQLVIPFAMGAINVYRGETPFTENDLDLVEPFAEAVSLGFRRYFDFQQLEQQNRKLEEATRLKSQFLATMSHELRTPMNAIIGFTGLVLRRADNLADRQRENLEKVRLSADHLLSLINDILDLSKVEAGRVDIEATEFDVTPVIKNCCATVGPTLGKPGVELIPDIQADLPNIYTDEARLRQILINLVSNALKFTDTGEVRVKVRLIETDLQISVSDTGIGIPEDQLDTIFEEFRQVDGSSTRHQGTGLGLAISKRLIELMDGTITVSSVVGKGSTFTLKLPKTAIKKQSP